MYNAACNDIWFQIHKEFIKESDTFRPLNER